VVKPARQEQEPATEQITEVAPNILRMQLPITMPGLGHVNCYALEDERGVAVVDPGLPGPAPWDALVGRLGSAGIPLARVHTVIVTHSHPDHFGGAVRIREETGADIVTHERFRVWWDPTETDAEDPESAPDSQSDGPPSGGPWDRPLPWGGQRDWGNQEEMMTSHREEMRTHMRVPRPSRRLEDAQVVSFAGREWVALHTPGHTLDHLCLYDPVEGVVLSGDHVLPTITPHISGVDGAGDPLALFFDSLDRMTKLEDVKIVLPAHGHPFNDLNGRVDAIKLHHDERLARLGAASAEIGRSASVRELMQHLFSERAWGWMAESETYAHLEHLRLSGHADSHWEDDKLYYDVN
jgi:glyoxylase-like metal-dependent hydrolase (beta-lactamase superfamily II)